MVANLARTAVVFVLALALAAPAFGMAFTTHLSGGEEVPAVDTNGGGNATFVVSNDGESVRFVLVVNNLTNVRAAHIHMAPQGQNGGVVVTLFGGPTTQGVTNGQLSSGSFTAADLSGGLAGQTIQDLVDAMAAGNTYVNVHTDAHPPGEIRGQIR